MGRTFASILSGVASIVGVSTDALTVSIAALVAANVDSLASDYVTHDAAVLVCQLEQALALTLALARALTRALTLALALALAPTLALA